MDIEAGDVDLELYEDSTGRLEIRGLIPHEALGGFLSSDIQHSDTRVQSVRRWLGTVGSEPAPPWRGNSSEVYLHGDTVTVICVYAASGERQGCCTLSRDDFAAALDAWQRAFQAHRRREPVDRHDPPA